MAAVQEKTKKEQTSPQSEQSVKTRTSTAIREPRMTNAAPSGAVQSGRPPKKKGDLIVERQ